MKKIINQPEAVVEEMLQGLVYAHGDSIKRLPESGARMYLTLSSG